jgi:hypothetical protein
MYSTMGLDPRISGGRFAMSFPTSQKAGFVGIAERRGSLFAHDFLAGLLVGYCL